MEPERWTRESKGIGFSCSSPELQADIPKAKEHYRRGLQKMPPGSLAGSYVNDPRWKSYCWEPKQNSSAHHLCYHQVQATGLVLDYWSSLPAGFTASPFAPYTLFPDNRSNSFIMCIRSCHSADYNLTRAPNLTARKSWPPCNGLQALRLSSLARLSLFSGPWPHLLPFLPSVAAPARSLLFVEHANSSLPTDFCTGSSLYLDLLSLR